MLVRSLGREDALEFKGTATHSSILAWRIPWTEEPGGLQSTGSQRVWHNWSELACMHYSHYSRLLLGCEGKDVCLVYSCILNIYHSMLYWMHSFKLFVWLIDRLSKKTACLPWLYHKVFIRTKEIKLIF